MPFRQAIRHNQRFAASAAAAPFLYVTYVLLFVQGVIGMIWGAPAIDLTAGETYGDFWPVGFIVATSGAFVGVYFSNNYNMRTLELVCSAFVVALLYAYAACLIIQGIAAPPIGRVGIGVGMFAHPMLIVWRGFSIVLQNSVSRKLLRDQREEEAK